MEVMRVGILKRHILSKQACKVCCSTVLVPFLFFPTSAAPICYQAIRLSALLNHCTDTLLKQWKYQPSFLFVIYFGICSRLSSLPTYHHFPSFLMHAAFPSFVGCTSLPAMAIWGVRSLASLGRSSITVLFVPGRVLAAASLNS